MPDLLLLYSLAALGGTLVGSAVVLPRMRRIARLHPSVDPAGLAVRIPSGPRAAVIVAARDEARTIEPALRSLLSQLDPGLRIVVVDDRSTDGTGAILEGIAEGEPGLLVQHVTDLPPGWLGKNHALAVGVAAAVADPDPPEYLLFTDADVVFEPGGVRGAIAHLEDHGLDHLAGAPRVHAASWALAGQIAAFGVLFGLFTRPWSVPNPQSSAHVGIGALNLVRRSAYERAGGHAAIAMRIDDDLRLGKAVKAAGGRSAFVFAGDVASLTWYPSLRAMLRGLHKNTFAGINYSWTLAVAATVFLLLVVVGPFVVAAFPSDWTGASSLARGLGAAVAALHLVGAAESARSAELPRTSALFFPLGILAFLAVLWRSAIGAVTTGRISWRDTSYSLKELRRAAPADPLHSPTESA
ncbi:glycosyltransferase [Planctomycetes bacterium Poly30]|uniref:glycosyltransferase n=1 Tax=Saltatorellus ferox TaxID=2528018 RepID=UPI0011A443CF